MRPVRRGPSPRKADFKDYTDAKPELVSRLGSYCSYCERYLSTGLAVGHILPKTPVPQLGGHWENFLLACVNCNSAKSQKVSREDEWLLPDRDNTFVAFEYSADGKIAPAPHLAKHSGSMARQTLVLVGLDKAGIETLDANGKLIALDRVNQRMQAWGEAEAAKADLEDQPSNKRLLHWIVETAKATGFFSIWMTVFAQHAHVRRKLIDAFPGTRESGCFAADGAPISPAPNPDGLPHGGKL